MVTATARKAGGCSGWGCCQHLGDRLRTMNRDISGQVAGGGGGGRCLVALDVAAGGEGGDRGAVIDGDLVGVGLDGEWRSGQCTGSSTWMRCPPILAPRADIRRLTCWAYGSRGGPTDPARVPRSTAWACSGDRAGDGARTALVFGQES